MIYFNFFFLVKKSTYKLKLLKKYKIHKFLFILLLNIDKIKKIYINNKNILVFDFSNNNKKYNIEKLEMT